MRFLLSRRWVLFALAVVVLALGAWRLGEWQFDRLDAREQRNEWVRTNLAAAPAPVEDVLAVGRPLPEDREWMRVRASGTYDVGATVVVRYRTRDGRAGVDVVTPLVTPGGTAVLVDRGWVATEDPAVTAADLPSAPSGSVRVTGWVRADATGRGIEVEDGSTRAVSSVTIGERLGYPVFAGYVEAQTEDPAPAEPPMRAEEPDLGEGPHLFYGLQWWFFGALAVGGFLYLVYDEIRRSGRGRTPGGQAEADRVRHP